MENAARKAGIDWKQNCIRHSYCSYAVATKGLDWTALQADHFTPLLIPPTSSRNDSGMPDTAKKPAAKKTPAARKPGAKTTAPTATASEATQAMLAPVVPPYKKAANL